MIESVYVLDIETDHLNYKFGSIVEIGIVKLNFISGEIKIVFSSLVQEEKKINSEAWIFKNSNLNFLDLIVAPTLEGVGSKLQILFLQGVFTAFNQDFDFGWLESRGFRIPQKFLDPMKVLTPVMKLPFKKNYSSMDNRFKYPSVEEAYFYLFKEHIIEKHRALSDAIIEAKILLKMYQESIF